MNCEQNLELLLEADIDELNADARGPLGEHLRGCERCRRRADLLVAEHRRLATALSAVENARIRSRRRRWTPARRAAAVLLPAAAVVGALLLARAAEEPEPIDPAALYAMLHPPRPVVEPQPGVRTAVVTTDQNLTLVLLYNGEER